MVQRSYISDSNLIENLEDPNQAINIIKTKKKFGFFIFFIK